MGLKKRNKAQAEFNMSSLTDIIFLLLVFFMLTATFVNVKKLDLPESNTKTVAPSSLSVSIDKDGLFYVNGQETSVGGIKVAVREIAARIDNPDKTTITIIAEKGVPFSQVMKVLSIASDLKLKAILATQPRR
ncbi:MAG: biopolymer transporter ExbD [Saprospiraceae bacterium]|nr:biopolymer transporter ExbD [Saprospiraceae bacterium]